jgi:queuine tRNA-ribosyltransferase
MRLAVTHNLYFYNDLMSRIRQALDNDSFDEFRREYTVKLDTRI